jgi:hypothetical protein
VWYNQSLTIRKALEMDVLKTRKAAAAKAYWIQLDIEEGGSPIEDELNFLLDYASPDDNLSLDETQLIRILHMALSNNYVADGPLEFPDDAERAELAKQLIE